MSRQFPHSETLRIGDHDVSAEDVIQILGPHLTDERREKIAGVVKLRTYSVAPVLDGIYDRGNISAVMRSAEAMGYQALHIIETQDTFKAANRVTAGTDKWLDITRWDEPAECALHLKELGYRIAVTHLDAAVPLGELDPTVPTALVFGNERDGVSPEMVEIADQSVIIPMSGFAQSFNISVAAAISLYHFKIERERLLGHHADLDDDEMRILEAHYILRSTRRPERILAHELS